MALRDTSARVVIAGAVIGCAAWMAVEYRMRPASDEPRSAEPPAGPVAPARLSAQPSDTLLATVRGERIPFEEMIVRDIRQRGCLTATVHVALADADHSNAPLRFTDGRHPGTNLTWGALYGVETHLANSGGWDRLYADEGDGRMILRRVLFRRHVQPTAAWQARGIDEEFDLFLLANAWAAEAIVPAMEQAAREALCGEPIHLELQDERRLLYFGGQGAITGYIGPNHLLHQYWDILASAEDCWHERQVGVFYLCSKSAAPLHMPLVERGAYSVLFAKSPITAEGYLLDGLMNGLAGGEFGGAFVREAASEYVRFQKSVELEIAERMFIR
jgi:hypothetical protein